VRAGSGAIAPSVDIAPEQYFSAKELCLNYIRMRSASSHQEQAMYWSSEHPESISLSARRPSRVAERSDTQAEEGDPSIDQEMLLWEMQHRVANSLQIVAGILSMKARTVKSKEARLHLMDACNRVLSIAAVQRQLLTSRHSSAIRIDDYLSELSEGLAASLAERVRLSVVVDGTATIESNKAVAIGLVMTELIINALKHAFPRKRRGTIIVAYRTTGPDWSLSVSDDGVGLANPSMNAGRSGYGTRIVDTLAKELDARVLVNSGSQGTRISLVHSASAAYQI
jgi:chemotaxis protein methyltransferase CheR